MGFVRRFIPALHFLSDSRGFSLNIAASEWSDGIAVFVNSPHMRGKRIVPIGHSAGAGAMSDLPFPPLSSRNNTYCRVLTTKDRPVSAIPYVSLILIEPTAIPRELFYVNVEDRVMTMEFVVAATATRRERWRSREEAHAWLARRIPWDSWDPRVLRKLSVSTRPPSSIISRGSS
jgi:hypothetical protein